MAYQGGGDYDQYDDGSRSPYSSPYSPLTSAGGGSGGGSIYNQYTPQQAPSWTQQSQASLPPGSTRPTGSDIIGGVPNVPTWTQPQWWTTPGSPTTSRPPSDGGGVPRGYPGSAGGFDERGPGQSPYPQSIDMRMERPDTRGWDTDGFSAPGFTAQRFGNAPAGFDRGKWMDPAHQTPKYVLGRIAASHAQGGMIDRAGMARAAADIQRAYPGSKWNGKDKIMVPGVGEVDLAGGMSDDGRGQVQYLVNDGGGSARASKVPQGGPAPDPYLDLITRLTQQQMPMQGGGYYPPPEAAPPQDNSQMEALLQTLIAEMQQSQQSRSRPNFTYY